MSRLLSHYWTADDPVASRTAQIADWIEDLGEFGTEIVADGCREWRRQPGGRRPTPGDIRAICIRLQREHRDDAARRLPPPAAPAEPSVPPLTVEDRAHCLAIAERAIARLKRIPSESLPSASFGDGAGTIYAEDF